MDPGSRRGWRRQLSYSNVMSTLVVVLVLAGGTAVAAGLSKNTVNSKSVKDNSLRGADLADGRGVTGADVADGSLSGIDIGDGSLNGADVADGSLRGTDIADGSLAGADIGRGALSAASIGVGAVDSSNVVDNGIRRSDIGTATLTNKQIDESTLGEVPGAAEFDGRPPSAFLSSEVRVGETPIQQGIPSGEGTFKITLGCATREELLAGGAANVSRESSVFESGPRDGAWTVRINPHGTVDPFSVVVLCAKVNG